MPDASRSLWQQLGQSDDLTKLDPTQLTWGGLREGTRLGEVTPIFPRLDKAKIMSEIENEKARQHDATSDAPDNNTAIHEGAHATQAAVPGAPTATETKPADPPMRGATEADAVPVAQQNATTADANAGQTTPDSPATPTPTTQATQGAAQGVVSLIGIEDFVKVEMRVGEILTAERVPKADKLLRFTVDVGEPQPRQILAGIAQYYEPEKLVGRKIVVVSNLQPRKLRGFESQGMVLAASVGDEGRPVLATFSEDVPNGARLK
jgi:methionyl-tRNA synthetase